MEALQREIDEAKFDIANLKTALATATGDREVAIRNHIASSQKLLASYLEDRRQMAAQSRNQNPIRVNRIARIVEKLKSGANISRPDKIVIGRIAKSDRLSDLASIDTNYAYQVYQDVKESAGTQTKSCIGNFLGMRVNSNGSVFDDFPFIISGMKGCESKLIKILCVIDGALSFEKDIDNEIMACNFRHEAIVSMEHHHIVIDVEMAQKANCRVEVIVMPWYTSVLRKFPSADFVRIATEGQRIFDALEFIHERGYVHLDVKAMNIFVTHDCHWYLGYFGSCKAIGAVITSSTFAYYYENNLRQQADPRHDWYMFLVMLLIESLEDRDAKSLFYSTKDSVHTDYNKVITYASTYRSDPIIGTLIAAILRRLGI